VYDSVRRTGGTNVCIYRPSLIILPVNQADRYECCWDAIGQANVLKLTNVASGSSAWLQPTPTRSSAANMLFEASMRPNQEASWPSTGPSQV
jgi:hypothetical protein